MTEWKIDRESPAGTSSVNLSPPSPPKRAKRRDDTHKVVLDLETILGFYESGTASRPEQVRRIELALRHLHEYRSERMPANGTRGGSSSPREVDDRAEERALTRQVERDLPILEKFLGMGPTIRAIVMRYTEPIALSKLPIPNVPGCVSCARTEQKGKVHIGGHFSPVMPASDEEVDGTKVHGNAEANRLGLCRNCSDHLKAAGKIPPVMYCHLLHTQSARAAGNWLVRQGKAA